MRRWILAWAVALVLVGGAAQRGHAQDGHGEDTAGEDTAAEDGPISALRGAAVYAAFCQACHGSQGEGAAPGPAFPAIEFDEARLREVLAHGATNAADDSAMPAYDDVLSEQQMDDLVTYMASWDEGDSPPLPAPNVGVVHLTDNAAAYHGDPQDGAVVYAIYCSGCHGVAGAGRGEAAFPALAFEGERTLQVVRSGHESQYMPAFGVEYEGPLDDEALQDLVSYMATWQEEHEESDVDGVGILVLFVGLATILGVGIVYLTRGPEQATD